MFMKLSCTSSASKKVIMFVPSATLSVFFYGVALLFCCPRGLSRESGVLLQIKESLLGGGITDFLADWSNSSDFCNWQGVKCESTSSASSHVISLVLPSRNISGHLSPMIGKLTRLKELDLSGNRLSGHLPPELGNCTRLQQLRLSENFFSGVIPSTLVNCSLLTLLDLSANNISGFILPELGELSNLSELYLFANNLSGAVPASLGKLANLQVLRAGYANSFTSSLPPEIGNCSKLTYISFASSNLSGTIPWEIGKLHNLKELYLFDNQLDGTIPSTIGNCKALEVFAAYENNIGGHIPREISHLRRLQLLWLFKNLLSGLLPAELGNMSMLQQISLEKNNLAGSLPEEIGRLKSLSYLDLSDNNISGRLPSYLGNFTRLQIINLQGNRFSGTLPEGIGFLPNLQGLYISRNSLEGQLPASLGNFSRLRILDAYSNHLSGEYPPNICKAKQLIILVVYNNSLEGDITVLLKDCVSLKRVRLQNNDFTGHIPSHIAKLSGLYYLELSFNRLHGEIQAEVGQLRNLTDLIVSGNCLTGDIPPQLGDLTNLGRLNMSSNNLSGYIPSQLGRLMNLERLDLSGNSLEGALPQHLGSNYSSLLILMLSFNKLTGTIPTSLGDCLCLIELDLSRNRLEGSIPREIGKLQQLSTGLHISRNRLSGSLPPEIGNLLLLESLDVSVNKLSGQIPPALEGLKLLSKFNFSFNRFTGRIPALKSFCKSEASAFSGNDALCGPPTSNSCLESSNNSTSDNKSLGSGTMIIILITGLAAVGLVVISFLYYRSRRKVTAQREELKREESILNRQFNIVKFDVGVGRERWITYEEILKATEEFSDNYLVGGGSSGRVYKVLLREAENSLAVAAKVFRLTEGRNCRLIREIDALKLVCHRNIIRFYGILYGGSINMDILLFEYMAKGSLGEALKSQSFGWKIRLNIALGVAQALKYLHHDCSPPIVHRDIKSANILLDDDYVAHVADFGLAKLMYSEGQICSSSVYVGTHGYMAPECGYGVRSSPKQDVFSFGVVLLELLTGKEAVVDEEEGAGESKSLAEWAAIMRENEGKAIRDLLDPELQCDFEKWGNEIENVFEISLLCTRPLPRKRPSIQMVLDLLYPPAPIVLQYGNIQQLIKMYAQEGGLLRPLAHIKLDTPLSAFHSYYNINNYIDIYIPCTCFSFFSK